MRLTPFLGGLAVMLTVFASGCGCDRETLYYESFEQCEAPCGFHVGPGVGVSIVTTIHPGEHALRVDAGAVLREFGGGEVVFALDRNQRLSVVATCVPTVRLVVATDRGESVELFPRLASTNSGDEDQAAQTDVLPYGRFLSEPDILRDAGGELRAIELISASLCVYDELGIVEDPGCVD